MLQIYWMPPYPRASVSDFTCCVYYTDELRVVPEAHGVVVVNSVKSVLSVLDLLRIRRGKSLVTYGQYFLKKRIPLVFVFNRVDQIVDPN